MNPKCMKLSKVIQNNISLGLCGLAYFTTCTEIEKMGNKVSSTVLGHIQCPNNYHWSRACQTGARFENNISRPNEYYSKMTTPEKWFNLTATLYIVFFLCFYTL